MLAGLSAVHLLESTVQCTLPNAFFESWTTAKFGNIKETSQVLAGILFTAEVHVCSESQ